MHSSALVGLLFLVNIPITVFAAKAPDTKPSVTEPESESEQAQHIRKIIPVEFGTAAKANLSKWVGKLRRIGDYSWIEGWLEQGHAGKVYIFRMVFRYPTKSTSKIHEDWKVRSEGRRDRNK